MDFYEGIVHLQSQRVRESYVYKLVLLVDNNCVEVSREWNYVHFAALIDSLAVCKRDLSPQLCRYCV